MNIEADYYDDSENIRLTLSLRDEQHFNVTVSKIGVMELTTIVPIDELKLAIRKLTAK